MGKTDFQIDYDKAMIVVLEKQAEAVRQALLAGDVEKAKKIADLRVYPGLYDVEDQHFLREVDAIFALEKKPAEPSIYERAPGTEQCMESCTFIRDEQRERLVPDEFVRHWPVCFREKGHKGPHRHWVYVDWTSKDTHVRLTIRIRKPKGAKK